MGRARPLLPGYQIAGLLHGGALGRQSVCCHRSRLQLCMLVRQHVLLAAADWHGCSWPCVPVVGQSRSPMHRALAQGACRP